MPLQFSWAGGARRMQADQLAAPHGLWHVTPPRADGFVELAYARYDEAGRLPGLPLPIGIFAAATEAVLAAEMHEAALAGDAPGPAPGLPFRQLAPDGEFVVEAAEAALRLHFLATLRGGSGEVACLRRPRPVAGSPFVEAERPPGLEDAHALDAAILMRIAALRAARAEAPALEPLTRAEAARWRLA